MSLYFLLAPLLSLSAILLVDGLWGVAFKRVFLIKRDKRRLFRWRLPFVYDQAIYMVEGQEAAQLGIYFALSGMLILLPSMAAILTELKIEMIDLIAVVSDVLGLFTLAIGLRKNTPD